MEMERQNANLTTISHTGDANPVTDDPTRCQNFRIDTIGKIVVRTRLHLVVEELAAAHLKRVVVQRKRK